MVISRLFLQPIPTDVVAHSPTPSMVRITASAKGEAKKALADLEAEAKAATTAREALDKARADGFAGTDDAQLVERLGIPVRVVSGSIRNIKITLPEDLALAESWLAAESGLAGEESR